MLRKICLGLLCIFSLASIVYLSSIRYHEVTNNKPIFHLVYTTTWFEEPPIELLNSLASTVEFHQAIEQGFKQGLAATIKALYHYGVKHIDEIKVSIKISKTPFYIDNSNRICFEIGVIWTGVNKSPTNIIKLLTLTKEFDQEFEKGFKLGLKEAATDIVIENSQIKEEL